MLIRIPSFTGLVPKQSDTKLPDNAAQTAINCDFTAGELAGIRGPADTGVTSGLSGFVYSRNNGAKITFSSPTRGEFVRGPVLQDDHERVYWTSDAGFRFFQASQNLAGGTPAVSYKVGVANIPQNSIRMDGSQGSIGSVTLAPRPPTISSSKLVPALNAARVVLVDESGEVLRDITGDVTSFVGIGTGYNGWHNEYHGTMSSPLSSYSSVSVATQQYRVWTGQADIAGWDVTQENIRVFMAVSTVAGRESVTPRFAAFEKTRTIGKTTTSGVGDSYSSEFVALQEGETAVLQSSGQRVAMIYMGNGEFSVDGSPIPQQLKDSLTSTGDVWGSSSFATRMEIRFPAAEGTAKYEATFVLGEEAKNVWNPDYMINVEFLPHSTDANKFVLKMRWGDASLPAERRAYLFTLVNQISEESGPLPPIEIDVTNGGVVTAFNLDPQIATMTTSVWNGRYPIHGLRVYRSSGAAGYLYAGTIKIGVGADLPGDHYLKTLPDSSSFYDDAPEMGLGEACSTIDYVTDVTELDLLRGVKLLYNGIVAAHKGNELWLSEPYKPWAWNRANVHTMPEKIIDILPAEQGAYILTEGSPHYVSGATPDTMVPTKILGGYPVLSSGAAVLVDGAPLYMSADGPVILNGAQAQLQLTNWSPEDWRDKLQAYGGDVKLVAFGHRVLVYFTGLHSGGYVFDKSLNAWSEFSENIEYATLFPGGTFPSYPREELVFSSGSGNWKIFGANQSSSALFVWHSKEFVIPKQINFSVLQVFGQGQVLVEVFANGTLTHSVSVAPLGEGRIVRLPSGFRASKWSFKLTAQTATTRITDFLVATSINELSNV